MLSHLVFRARQGRHAATALLRWYMEVLGRLRPCPRGNTAAKFLLGSSIRVGRPALCRSCSIRSRGVNWGVGEWRKITLWEWESGENPNPEHSSLITYASWQSPEYFDFSLSKYHTMSSQNVETILLSLTLEEKVDEDFLKFQHGKQCTNAHRFHFLLVVTFIPQLKSLKRMFRRSRYESGIVWSREISRLTLKDCRWS